MPQEKLIKATLAGLRKIAAGVAILLSGCTESPKTDTQLCVESLLEVAEFRAQHGDEPRKLSQANLKPVGLPAGFIELVYLQGLPPSEQQKGLRLETEASARVLCARGAP